MQGYNELIRKIKPKAIICYDKSFDEMQGKFITVDYAKTNNLNQNNIIFDTYVKKMHGYVCHEKGMGSAGWRKNLVNQRILMILDF